MSIILLVEDDPVLGRSLSVGLEAEGYQVSWAMDLASARSKNRQSAFDLILLDVNLPDGTGFDFCREIRDEGSRIPIIMLTARSDEDSAVTGLHMGANDYVKKPFGSKELQARIQVALKEPVLREQQIRYGPVLALLGQRKILIDKIEIDFNRREFDIFAYLLARPEAVISREDLISATNNEGEIFDRTIDSHVSHIRNKLKKLEVAGVAIQSVYGVGYRLQKI